MIQNDCQNFRFGCFFELPIGFLVLLKLDPNSQVPNWPKYTTDDGLPADYINTLRIDPNNNYIWVATSEGLGKFDIEAGSCIAYTETSGEKITHLELNSRGEVWFSTDQGIQMRDEPNLAPRI